MLKRLVHQRHIFSTSQNYSTTWKEIRIPVPWGHVAGKWWGSEDKQPILASHGWLDNSGTFDTLIPRLLTRNSVLAIDMPGCGYSSKIPFGMFYHFIDSVILLKRIVKHFDWQKVSLLGHSMGSMTNYGYTMLYPEDVKFLICLDGFMPFSSDNKRIEHMRKNVNNFLKYNDLGSLNKEPPSYSYQEIEQKMYDSYKHWIDFDKCKHILERNIRPSTEDPNKYYFSTDMRLKVWDLLRWSEDELIQNAVRLVCPILLIKASTSPFFENKLYTSVCDKVIEIIKTNNKNFEIHEVNGAHHLHLNTPEAVESIINQFISKFEVANGNKLNNQSRKAI